MELNTLVKKIGELIKKEREKRSLTQQELAGKCKLSISTIANIEKGRYPDLKLSSIYQISKVLRIRVSKLMYHSP